MTATTIITAIINRDVRLQFFSRSMTGNLPVSWQSTELPSLHAHPSTAVCITNGDMLLTILSTNYTNSLCQRWGGVMRDKPPFSFVWGQDSTMWDIVWVSPQGHRSVSVSRHFLLQALQCPCSQCHWSTVTPLLRPRNVFIHLLILRCIKMTMSECSLQQKSEAQPEINRKQKLKQIVQTCNKHWLQSLRKLPNSGLRITKLAKQEWMTPQFYI